MSLKKQPTEPIKCVTCLLLVIEICKMHPKTSKKHYLNSSNAFNHPTESIKCASLQFNLLPMLHSQYAFNNIPKKHYLNSPNALKEITKRTQKCASYQLIYCLCY